MHRLLLQQQNYRHPIRNHVVRIVAVELLVVVQLLVVEYIVVVEYIAVVVAVAVPVAEGKGKSEAAAAGDPGWDRG
jgi:hypothetical protein